MFVSNSGNGFNGNWDVYIFLAPTFYDSSTTGSRVNYNVPNNLVQFGSSGTTPLFSGVCAFTVPSGTPFNFATWGSNPGSGYLSFNLQTSPSYITDSMRAISSGIEVHNTTSELNKQGTVVCFRQPVNSSRYASSYSAFAGSSIVGAFSAVNIAGPPATPAAALAFSDSTQWNAAKGCYLPCALQSMDLPYNANAFTLPFFYANQPSDANQSTSSPNVTGGFYGITSRLWTEFAMSGAVFGGLSNSTTLTVNWNVIYEIQAAGQSTLLENIATPSPPLDLKAMRVLAMLHHLLPIAVEVDRNGLGDWIASAAGAVSRAIRPTLTAMAPSLAKMKHPIAQMVAAAVKKQPTNDRQKPRVPKVPKTTAVDSARSRQQVNKGNHGSMITPSSGNAPGSTS
jgi:hypothetical protein